MVHVIPTDFAFSKKEFKEKFAKLVKISHAIQIDFMDGDFVPVKSVHLKDVPDLRKYNIDFEAHLMVKHPKKWIKGAAKKGFNKLIFHVEVVKSKKKGMKIIEMIRLNGMKPMIAINSDTSFFRINPFLKYVEGVLVMGIHAGAEHQSLAKNTTTRIKILKKRFPKLWVQVDGGVNDKTIGVLACAGVDAVNSGSFVSDAKNPKSALTLLEKKFR